MKTILILALIFLASCNKWCDPVNIKSGKSLQHHNTKKFRASIRIMRVQQFGNFCRVRYSNMKLIADRVYENCDCKKFKVGSWVNQDSI